MALPYNSFITFDLGPVTIHAYGIMVAVGFIAAILIGLWGAKRKKLNPEHIYGLAVWIIIGAIAGSRIFYVIGSWQYFAANPIEILVLWKGGLSYIGGLIGALTTTYFYIKNCKLPYWKYADVVAPGIALGHVFGRIGCILGDGGHIGKITTMPWGVIVEGQLRHMTAFYDMIAELIIFGILIYLMKRKSFEGFLLPSYVMLYCSQRFFTDFLRIDQIYLGLTGTQYTCILLFLVFGFFVLKKKGKL
ncbi:prolipoprotein diacylglyceryl transferase [Candidatus Woesearchaeota archaeon]|nr:prolipoprotein diacylglyceryl transferase [Candidatus Woesearchaeota archaeon]